MSDAFDLETQRELAKLGMAASLGTAVLTTPFLKRNKGLRKVHTGAGMLLVGFSLWHHWLYQPQQRQAKPLADRRGKLA